MSEIALDRSDLKRVFGITAIAVFVIAAAAALPAPLWALRFGVAGYLALFNWIALALIMVGATSRRPLYVVAGIMLKPLLLVSLLIYAVHLEIEITSFLLAINSFFLCLFGYMSMGGKAKTLRRETARSWTEMLKDAHG